jgi:hypothetical protein
MANPNRQGSSSNLGRASQPKPLSPTIYSTGGGPLRTVSGTPLVAPALSLHTLPFTIFVSLSLLSFVVSCY